MLQPWSSRDIPVNVVWANDMLLGSLIDVPSQYLRIPKTPTFEAGIGVSGLYTFPHFPSYSHPITQNEHLGTLHDLQLKTF